MLSNGYCRPIKERLNPKLDYVYIHIRMAWNPAPSPVEKQAEEIEPPIHVAITFKQVVELMDRLKATGVEKAEFCLVGWNKSGHDGR